MTYVSNILLNFQERILDIWEWENHEIIYVEKILLFKVTTKELKKMWNNNFTLSDAFLNKIINSCDIEGVFNKKVLKYAFIVSDEMNALAINYISENLINKSRLWLEDEKKILELVKRNSIGVEIKNFLKITKQPNSKIKGQFILRNDYKKMREVQKNLRKAYVDKQYNLIKYLYYEIFDSEIKNYKKAYNEILKSLDETKNIKKLYELFELIQSNRI